MVEELLTPTDTVRQGILEFFQSTVRRAEIAFVVVEGTSATRDVPYSRSSNPGRGHPHAPNTAARDAGLVPEGIFAMATTFAREPPERPVIVVIAMARNAPDQRSRQQPQAVLDRLRDGSAQLHVVSVQAPRSSGGGGDTRYSANDPLGRVAIQFPVRAENRERCQRGPRVGRRHVAIMVWLAWRRCGRFAPIYRTSTADYELPAASGRPMQWKCRSIGAVSAAREDARTGERIGRGRGHCASISDGIVPERPSTSKPRCRKSSSRPR